MLRRFRLFRWRLRLFSAATRATPRRCFRLLWLNRHGVDYAMLRAMLRDTLL